MDGSLLIALFLLLESELSKVTVSVAFPVVVEGVIKAIVGVLSPATSSLVIEKGKEEGCEGKISNVFFKRHVALYGYCF